MSYLNDVMHRLSREIPGDKSAFTSIKHVKEVTEEGIMTELPILLTEDDRLPQVGVAKIHDDGSVTFHFDSDFVKQQSGTAQIILEVLRPSLFAEPSGIGVRILA